MSAFREFKTEPPHVKAQKHRLNQTQVETKPAIIRKKSPQLSEVPEIVVEVVESASDTYLQPSWHASNLSLDEDFDPFEDEEDDLTLSQTVEPCKRSSQELLMYVYETACKRHKLLPLTCVKKGLLQQSLSCRFVNLTKDDCLCICYALCNDRFVERLDFRQNGMGPEPARFFAEIIENSPFLTHIRIADNDLKSAGVKPICKAVRENTKIKCLDLSGNGLVESDAEYFEKLIEESHSLIELNLAHNNLMDLGVRRISEALKRNDTLEILDLSWNHIRLKGAEAIGEALEVNNCLLKVNLEWNGLHQDGAYSIARALQKNDTLIDLNIASNRLSEFSIAEILRGLDNNSSLETLRIGKNQVTTRGAFSILKHIKENTSSRISLLDFGNQEVHDDFEELYKEMKNERDIEVLYGAVWQRERSSLSSSAVSDDEVALLSCNPLTVLMECMRLQNMRLLDFFKSLDTDKSNMICIDELCDGMLKVGVPVRKHILLQLLNRLDKDKNAKLDYGEMVEAQNMHRNNLRKIFAASSNIEFERTEIGKVSLILRRVMNKNLIMKSSDVDSRRRSPKLKEKPSRSNTPSPFLSSKEKNRPSRSNTPSPFLFDQLETSLPDNKINELTTPGQKMAKSYQGTLRVSSASSNLSNDSSARSGSSRVSSAGSGSSHISSASSGSTRISSVSSKSK